MKSRIRERFNRILVGALLQSDFTTLELEELADDLSKRPEAWTWLGLNLADAVYQTSRSAKKQRETALESVLFDAAKTLVQKRKMSARALLAVMYSVAPTMTFKPLAMKPSTQSLLEDFFLRASDSEGDRLVSLLSAKRSEDPYLAGIEQKLR